MGGRWGCELTVSLKFAQTIIERYKNSRVGTGVANLHYPWDLQSPPYKDTIIQGWTLALQTYCVHEICSVYQTKIQKFKGSRLALQTYSVREICSGHYTKIHKHKGGCWCYTLTVSLKLAKSTTHKYKNSRIQTYSALEICNVFHTKIQNSRVSIYHTKIQKTQGWTLALQTYNVICKVYLTKIQKFKGGH